MSNITDEFREKLTLASTKKCRFVIECARKDPQFMANLARDVAGTLSRTAVDLSPGELLAMVDVVNDTNYSVLSGYLDDLKSRWADIARDHPNLIPR